MNIRLLIAAAGCFVVGTGAGTVWAMRGAAAAATHAASEASDTIHADPHAVDAEPGADADADASHDGAASHVAPSAQDAAASHVEPAAQADTKPHADAKSTPPKDAAHSTADSAHAAPVPTTPVAAGRPAQGEDAARLARIFGAMRPEEAARLLEPLPETDVTAVLFALSDRKAAAILANFKGERGAALARALIANGGGR